MNNPTPDTDEDKRVAAGWSQLNLVLSFYSRIDTKASIILGLDVGMIATIFARVPPLKEVSLLLCMIAIPFFIAIVTSLWRLHSGSRPRLNGGTNSLIYFRSIAGMRESEFIAACQKRPAAGLADDLFEQAWRNSTILTQKFSHLQGAHDAALLAAIPWLGLLVLTSK